MSKTKTIIKCWVKAMLQNLFTLRKESSEIATGLTVHFILNKEKFPENRGIAEIGATDIITAY
jgi:hypothetical protein